MMTHEEAYQIYDRLKDMTVHQSNADLVMGRLLKTIRDEKIYKQLDLAPTFKAFIADAEIGLRPSTVYQLIRIAELYQDKLHISPNDINKVSRNRLIKLASYLGKLDSKKAYDEFYELTALSSSDLHQALVDRGVASEKAVVVSNDELTTLQVIEFDPRQTSKVVNRETKEVVWRQNIS